LAQEFGVSKTAIAMESHGRDDLIEDIDVSRTVGWFTSVYPVVLELNNVQDLGRHLMDTKESLHKVPAKGMGYWLFKYLTDKEETTDLSFALQPQIAFNYLGQFDSDVEQLEYSFATESPGEGQAKQPKRDYMWEVSGMTAGDQLRLGVAYNPTQFTKEKMEAFALAYKASLLELIKLCASKKEQELTPSDLIYNDMSIDDLESIFD
jgi:non-ribosomal peptide synthase protein (TIGR01720 family)